jgi:hypothetical protein
MAAVMTDDTVSRRLDANARTCAAIPAYGGDKNTGIITQPYRLLVAVGLNNRQNQT